MPHLSPIMWFLIMITFITLITFTSVKLNYLTHNIFKK